MPRINIEVTEIEPALMQKMSLTQFKFRLRNARSWFNHETEKDRAWWSSHSEKEQSAAADIYFKLEEMDYLVELCK